MNIIMLRNSSFEGRFDSAFVKNESGEEFFFVCDCWEDNSFCVSLMHVTSIDSNVSRVEDVVWTYDFDADDQLKKRDILCKILQALIDVQDLHHPVELLEEFGGQCDGQA